MPRRIPREWLEECVVCDKKMRGSDMVHLTIKMPDVAEVHHVYYCKECWIKQLKKNREGV